MRKEESQQPRIKKPSSQRNKTLRFVIFVLRKQENQHHVRTEVKGFYIYTVSKTEKLKARKHSRRYVVV